MKQGYYGSRGFGQNIYPRFLAVLRLWTFVSGDEVLLTEESITDDHPLQSDVRTDDSNTNVQPLESDTVGTDESGNGRLVQSDNVPTDESNTDDNPPLSSILRSDESNTGE